MRLKVLFILFLVLYISIVSAESLNYTTTDGKLTGTETISATGYGEVHSQNNNDQPYDIAIDRLKEGKTPDHLEVARVIHLAKGSAEEGKVMIRGVARSLLNN